MDNAPVHLRSILLFYDVIETFSEDQPIGIPPLQDYRFLEQEGILRRTSMKIESSGPPEKLAMHAKFELFNKLNNEAPGRWVLGSTGQDDTFDPAVMTDNQGLLVDLFGKLPVPSGEVPLDEVLNFRAKRKPELLRLRYEIESLYGKIYAASEYISTIEVERFDGALADYLKGLRETSFKKILSKITSNLNVNFTKVALSAGGAELMYQLHMSEAIVGALSALSLTAGVSLKGAKASASPFQYVGQYHTELPWQ